MKVAAQMRPTRRLTEPGSPVGFGFVKLGIAFIAISLKDSSCLLEMLVDVFFLPIRGEVIDGPRRRRTRPRALIADIGPDPAFPDALAQTLVAQGPVENPDRGIVGMQEITGHDPGCDPFDQGVEHLAGAPAPVDQRAVWYIGSKAGEDLVLAIQWQVVIEFGDPLPGKRCLHR